MTEVAERDLSKFDGKKVIVQRKAENGELEEIEGTVQTGNELGLLLKPKGKSSVEIIEAGLIEDVTLAPEKEKKLTVKYIKDVELGQARQHLVDRHAMTLTEANKLSEQDAFDLHAEIDHAEEDLGHRHGEKPKAEKKSDEAGDDESAEAGDDDESAED